MVAKYLIAGAISAALAGGAVYVAADAAELHPHDTVQKRDAKTAKAKDRPAPKAKKAEDDNAATRIERMLRDTKTESGEDKVVHVAQDHDTPKRDKAVMLPTEAELAAMDDDALMELLDGSDKSVLSAMAMTYDLGVSADDMNEMSADEARMAIMKGLDRKRDDAVAKPASDMKTMVWGGAKAKKDRKPNSGKKAWLDDYLTSSDDKDEEAVESDDADTDEDAHARTLHMMHSKPRDPARTTVERLPEAPRTDKAATSTMRPGSAKGQGTFVIAPGMSMATPEEVEAFTGDMKHFADPSAATPVLVAEAEKIEIVEARDDAYFSIMKMLLEHQQYGRAGDMIDRLSTSELRDTARQSMGVSLVKWGRLDEAFAVLDDIENEGLADPIRVAIIRAAAERGH